MNATTTTDHQPASNEAERKAGFAAPSGSAIEKLLSTWARRVELLRHTSQGQLLAGALVRAEANRESADTLQECIAELQEALQQDGGAPCVMCENRVG